MPQGYNFIILKQKQKINFETKIENILTFVNKKDYNEYNNKDT